MGLIPHVSIKRAKVADYVRSLSSPLQGCLLIQSWFNLINLTGPGVKDPVTMSHDYLENCAVDVARQLADGSMKKPKRNKSGKKLKG